MKAESAILFEASARGLNSKSLLTFVNSACRAAGLRGSVSVLISNSLRLRDLNFRHRAKNAATDVLSFPSGELGNGFAGDIVISHDIAAANAHALGHSLSEEIRILILHGILHLAGYDHENDHGEMEQKEAVLRNKMGLPTGLIERTLESAKPAVGNRSSAKLRSSSNSQRRRTNHQRRKTT